MQSTARVWKQVEDMMSSSDQKWINAVTLTIGVMHQQFMREGVARSRERTEVYSALKMPQHSRITKKVGP